MINLRGLVLAVLVALGILTQWQESRVALSPYLSSTVDSHKATGTCEVPPVVHFVQLKKDETSTLHFSFEAFLALYAAYRFIQPSAIYIHTDFSAEDIASAAAHGSSWTRKVLTAFPDLVHLHPVAAPTQANGRPIAQVEHRSDFVRLDQLAALGGGIYLDWDVVTLRPLAPLRRAGFRAVVGRQFDGFINNGILLACPGAGVVDVMRNETPRVFDGGWITHSVALLTTVANRLASVPGEVLIMDHKAFAPYEWSQASVDDELQRHVGDAVEGGAPPSTAGTNYYDTSIPVDAKQAWETRFTKEEKKAWEYDFSDAYFIHKIYNSVEGPKGYEGVSVPYILARDSNYALATWPIVMHGLQEGIIDAKDGSL